HQVEVVRPPWFGAPEHVVGPRVVVIRRGEEDLAAVVPHSRKRPAGPIVTRLPVGIYPAARGLDIEQVVAGAVDAALVDAEGIDERPPAEPSPPAVLSDEPLVRGPPAAVVEAIVRSAWRIVEERGIPVAPVRRVAGVDCP